MSHALGRFWIPDSGFSIRTNVSCGTPVRNCIGGGNGDSEVSRNGNGNGNSNSNSNSNSSSNSNSNSNIKTTPPPTSTTIASQLPFRAIQLAELH
ncbi:MAG: hypothetical protein ABJC26_11705 [Gemmatimonadaceae bacterium]